MAFAPDAVIASGDHVYWDLRTGPASRRGNGPYAVGFGGLFDRTMPVLSTANERVLKRAVGLQVAEMYGALFGSTPVYFLQDGHDYFEGDNADDEIVSFPRDRFMLKLDRASQRMYYPEFLPYQGRPAGLAANGADDRGPGLSESFGTLRWGHLAEINLFDHRRYLTMAGPTATFVPPEVEAWLIDRATRSDAAHVVNVPSTPPSWSAGKWAEWYPDVLEEGTDKLTVAQPKPYRQPGWRAQHDRLLAAASARRGRIPLIISGDLHATAENHIRRSGALDLSANPVVSILPGALGTKIGRPSRRRGTVGVAPIGVEVEERLPALEGNGFALCDFTVDRVVVSFFRWKDGQPEAGIDTLQPFRISQLTRPA